MCVLHFEAEGLDALLEASLSTLSTLLCLRWLAILKLTCWICGANSSTLRRKRAHQVVPPRRRRRPLLQAGPSTPYPASVGCLLPTTTLLLLDIYSQVDILRLRYEFVNFEAQKCTSSLSDSKSRTHSSASRSPYRGTSLIIPPPP